MDISVELVSLHILILMIIAFQTLGTSGAVIVLVKDPHLAPQPPHLYYQPVVHKYDDLKIKNNPYSVFNV